jgi:hypothetical protein
MAGSVEKLRASIHPNWMREKCHEERLNSNRTYRHDYGDFTYYKNVFCFLCGTVSANLFCCNMHVDSVVMLFVPYSF